MTKERVATRLAKEYYEILGEEKKRWTGDEGERIFQILDWFEAKGLEVDDFHPEILKQKALHLDGY